MNETPPTWRDEHSTPDTRAKALLAEMTLQEKVAQLGSYWNRPESQDGGADVGPMQDAFEAARRPFETAVQFGLGQLTRVFGTAPVSAREGIAALRAAQAMVVSTSRFGIPAIVHEECLTGFTTYGATVYPAAIAWGATFDDDLVQRMASAIGRDLRSVGVHQGLAPLLDVVRDSRWGRVEETMGEDPYVVGSLGSAYVRGLQSAGVIATLKHFAGYPASRAGRNHAPVSMGAREFQDIILTPFEAAVRVGGARSVMNSYSDIDGLPAAASTELLTSTLRDRWGFTGTVVSDYWAIAFLDLMHHVSPHRARSGSMALRAGIDVELPDADAYAQLAGEIAAGRIDEALVDRAVLRVLTQKIEIGLLDADWTPVPLPTGDGSGTDLDCPDNRCLAREVAEKSIVLLRNDGILPLRLAPGRVAVIGPTADSARSFLGCYSFPNHVLVHHTLDDLGVPAPSLFDALREALPGSDVVHAQGAPFFDDDVSGIPSAVELAKGADLVVLAVGDIAALFGRGTSGEGCDAEDLNLPGVQGQLVDAVLATGAPVVLVTITGRPYALGRYEHRCAAILQAFLPGEEGGHAIARVLTGRVNPSGHLPVGVPAHPGGQPYTYLAPPLGQNSAGISNLDPRPLYPFGYGLSYTTFGYDELVVSDTELPSDGTITVSALVTNTGRVQGDDVVQLYLTDEVAQVTRPVTQLIGYGRVSLEPGASARVEFEVHADRTAFTGVGLRRIVEPGVIELSIGHSSADRPLRQRLEIVGAVRVVDDPRLVTPVRITPERGQV